VIYCNGLSYVYTYIVNFLINLTFLTAKARYSQHCTCADSAVKPQSINQSIKMNAVQITSFRETTNSRPAAPATIPCHRAEPVRRPRGKDAALSKAGSLFNASPMLLRLASFNLRHIMLSFLRSLDVRRATHSEHSRDCLKTVELFVPHHGSGFVVQDNALSSVGELNTN